MAHSNVEAEYKAIAQGICEVIWLEKLMMDLNIPIFSPIRLYSDSKSTISIVNNLVQHDRMNYVRIDRHFVKQKIENGGISLSYVPTEFQEADILTKAMPTS